MWIIIDRKISHLSKNKLSDFGSLIECESKDVVYDAISGHPDIFMCQVGNKLILSPNAPPDLLNQLIKSNIDFISGDLPLKSNYPDTAKYNAVVTNKYLIHNSKVTDKIIKDCCKEKIMIHTNQAYTRCNLIAFDDESFITSDKGIEKSLLSHQLNVFYVDPTGIDLIGYSNGFFGGCCGVHDNKLFINGNLIYYSAKDSVIAFVKNVGYSITELYYGPMMDGGGIFFLNP